MTNPQPPTPRQQLDALLDSQFNAVAQQLNQAYSRALQRGVLNTRLDQLNQEAQRLITAGQSLKADNPVLRALLADLETVLGQQAALMGSLSGGLEDGAITAASRLTRDLALGGINGETLARLGFSFNVPDPEVIANVVNTTNSQEFDQWLQQFGTTEAERIRQIILGDIAAGRNPLTIARYLARTIDGLPRSDMNTFMRTLQLSSYRKAQDVLALANSDILEKKIRIASLDGRCCLACAFAHGSELRIDESVEDHHNGRCTAILVVKGRPMNVRSGVDWYNSLSESQQRALAGNPAYEALKAGAVKPTDFIGTYQDKLFGMMLKEKSLKEILGQEARRYYNLPVPPTPAPTRTNTGNPYTRVIIGTGETPTGSPIPPGAARPPQEKPKTTVTPPAKRRENSPPPLTPIVIPGTDEGGGTPIPPRRGG